MMTIKQFATLCGCNAQTLRYYDKIGLLKPKKVDPWSGYRYYEQQQAVDFVKIKNLQAADFAIEEIKVLIKLPDNHVFEAFEQKIAEQTEKLERIKEIQQSYLTEMNTMRKLITTFCNHLMERAMDPRILREFDMTAEDAMALVQEVQQLMISRTLESGENARNVTLIVDDQLYEGSRAMEKLTFLVQDDGVDDTVYLNADNVVQDMTELMEGMETVWEIHGWSHAYTFLENIPMPEDGRQYKTFVRHCDKAISDTLSYPLFLIGAMLKKGYLGAAEMDCYVEHSDDGKNHFLMMRRT